MGVTCVPVVANGRDDVWSLIDSDVADLLTGRSLSLGSHGYPQIFWRGRVEVLHRMVMGCVPKDGKIVDHISGQRLDNRRANLRLVTAAENTQNRRQARLHRGAYATGWGKWTAQVKHNGKTVRLGNYATPEEAAAVAKAYRLEHFTACTT